MQFEPVMGFELMTSSLPRMRSTPELHRLNGAEDEVRTRDPQLGRLMLYQLSYFRGKNSGEGRIRTSEGISQQIYSLPQLATLVPLRLHKNLEPMEGFEPPTS